MAEIPAGCYPTSTSSTEGAPFRVRWGWNMNAPGPAPMSETLELELMEPRPWQIRHSAYGRSITDSKLQRHPALTGPAAVAQTLRRTPCPAIYAHVHPAAVRYATCGRPAQSRRARRPEGCTSTAPPRHPPSTPWPPTGILPRDSREDPTAPSSMQPRRAMWPATAAQPSRATSRAMAISWGTAQRR